MGKHKFKRAVHNCNTRHIESGVKCVIVVYRNENKLLLGLGVFIILLKTRTLNFFLDERNKQNKDSSI